MFTANTMSTAIEALGMALPYSSSNPAAVRHDNSVDPSKQEDCIQAARAVMTLLKAKVRVL